MKGWGWKEQFRGSTQTETCVNPKQQEQTGLENRPCYNNRPKDLESQHKQIRLLYDENSGRYGKLFKYIDLMPHLFAVLRIICQVT